MAVTIDTARLVLRYINIDDLKAIHELHSMPETDKYNTLGIPSSIKETEAIIKPWILEHQEEVVKTHTFAIVLKEEFIGLIAIKLGSEKFRIAEVWYKLHKQFWGKGYATEALNRMLEFGFEVLALHRIEAGCAVANIGSIRVLEKSGMTREGRKRQILPLKYGWSDNFTYAILASDQRK